MAKKIKLDTGETIVVSKWLQEMWDFEEKHPFVSGSRLSSKSWAPAPVKKKRASASRKTASKPRTVTRR